jgi:hypothetical protein
MNKKLRVQPTAHRGRLVDMRIIPILVAIAAMTSPSFAADPPTISISAPSNPHAQLHEAQVDVRAAGDAALVMLRVGLVSTSGQLPTARMSISLPPDARVIGMELAQANQTFIAESMTTVDARGELDVHKEWIDPAVLEWRGETASHRRFLLTMAPITDKPSTVTVLLSIPHLQTLDFDVAGSRRTIPRSAFGRASAQERAMTARHDFVTRDVALYAGPTDPRADDGVEYYARATYYSLRGCYGGSQRRDVILHFTIKNGRIYEPSVDGAPEKTDGCVAHVLEHWTFREFGSPVRVDYPLQIIPLGVSAELQ